MPNLRISRRCMIAVLGLLLFVAFNDRTEASYAVVEAQQAADVAMELQVEGTREPAAFSEYFPALLGYDKPPPRHSWSTVLPAEAIPQLIGSLLSLRACRQMDWLTPRSITVSSLS